MKLRAKILLLLISAIIPVMIFITGLGIYFFNYTLKKEAVKSHKLMYSLFLPTISNFLWEFDTDGVKNTVANIMKNNYATDIYVYDMDGSLVLGFIKNTDTDTIEEVKDDTQSQFPFSQKKIAEVIEKSSDPQKSNLIEVDTVKSISTVLGFLYHKKIDSTTPDNIGHIVFTYSNKEIEKIITKAMIIIVTASIFLTAILVILISILLRKTLIQQIITLNNASIVISMGRKKTIKEKKGNDEIAELIRNFNIMGNQIFQNQEYLKMISDESIKISSCLTIHSLASQMTESINRLSNSKVDFQFYISSNIIQNAEKKGFIKIIINDIKMILDENNIISFEKEYIVPKNIKRTFIRDSISGHVVSIIDLKITSEDENSENYKREDKIYSAFQALQVSASSSLSTMKFINEQKEQLRLVGEQETARLVQQNLLPTHQLKKVSHFEIIGYFEAATECGGDWWSFYELANQKILVLLGDVTGHGTGSALLTAVVKGYCDSLIHMPSIHPTTILLHLNKIVAKVGKGERVMTMFAAIIDPISKQIEFSNASQNFPFHIQNSNTNKLVTKLIAQGKPLGVDVASKEKEKLKYASKVVSFEENDFIFIYSDGLTEALNRHGVDFSDKNLKRILEDNRNKNIIEIKNEVLKEFRKFIDSATLADDVTFVICKYIRAS